MDKFLDMIFKVLGICGFAFFLIFRSVFRGVLGFIVGAVMLYVMVGMVAVIVAHVFSWLCHLYLGH
jgi:hypothetical protein